MHNHNKFDRVFVALPPAIFTLCVSLLAARSLTAVSPNSSDSTKAIVCLQLKAQFKLSSVRKKAFAISFALTHFVSEQKIYSPFL